MRDNKTGKRIYRTIYRTILKTPHGEMIAMATNEGLCFLEFMKPDRERLTEKRLQTFFREYEIIDHSNSILEETSTWLDLYYSSNFDQLETPPLDLRGSEFELTVWRVLKEIPLGQTMSYGEMAKKIGKPTAARAVGNTNRRNPIPLIIPCHRVIGRDNSLTGYGGGLDLKKTLLEHERQEPER